jgi:hypothetical protein
MESQPLPSLRDFGEVGVLCTFTTVYSTSNSSSSSSWVCQRLAAEQLSMAVQYYMAWATRPAPITVKIIHHLSTHLHQLRRAGRRVGSVLYGLRPLWLKLPEKSWRLIIHIIPLETGDCVSLSTSCPASKVCTQ